MQQTNGDGHEFHEAVERLASLLGQLDLTAASSSSRDPRLDDFFARASHSLSELKSKISWESKKNFALVHDLRLLDSRIALVVNYKSAELEADFSQVHFNDSPHQVRRGDIADPQLKLFFGNLINVLQNQPQYLARLAHVVSAEDMNSLIHSIMFTIYGNQYVFREEHLLLSLLEISLQQEFEAAMEPQTLLRANTAVSRMMTTYTKRGPGQKYVQDTLRPLLETVLADSEMNFEIDPSRIFEEIEQRQPLPSPDSEVENQMSPRTMRSVSMQVALQNTQVQAILAQRIPKFNQVLEDFLTRLIDDIDDVPFGIRWLCKKIKLLLERRFPSAPREQSTSLIGGFFLLRYLNPAIISSDNHIRNISDHENALGKRNLCLFAKALQMLANKPAFLKVPYMSSLEFFSDKNQHRMQKFLLNLCLVDDFYDALEVEKNNGAIGDEHTLDITLTELYSIHSQITAKIDYVAPDTSDPLRDLLESGPAGPTKIAREDDCIVTLRLGRWNIDASAPTDMRQRSFLMQSTLSKEEMAVVDVAATSLFLLRVVASKGTVPDSFESLLEAATQPDLGIATDAARVAQIISMLEVSGELVPEGRRVIFQVALARFKNLEASAEKKTEEMVSLDKVRKMIFESNEFLKTQFDVYQQYLDNVRGHVGVTKTPLLRRLVSSIAMKSSSIPTTKITYPHMESQGLIVQSAIPTTRRNGIHFIFSSPAIGCFSISLHYRGREMAIVTTEFQLDDLLDMNQQSPDAILELGEYIQLDASKILHMITRLMKK